ncbi:hypothetical protein XI00_35785 [Bradyrhizobium sp. CCBAU 21359]|uniref:hypothetical protein n=1 Tax=unclassified Bradyrhizobium TaxID=2631580 RepID=UPI002304E178|nr:hypothetical protein [Bradyrhizobium sp. CCBAU 21359]MDA9459545.1 hypothetical protein [Bradyrhizobium sp. CCBAU 21359]
MGIDAFGRCSYREKVQRRRAESPQVAIARPFDRRGSLLGMRPTCSPFSSITTIAVPQRAIRSMQPKRIPEKVQMVMKARIPYQFVQEISQLT